jgi:hypothetical protein
MRKKREAVSVRVDARSHKYLKLSAEHNDWSITETIKVLCNTLEDMCPAGDFPTSRFNIEPIRPMPRNWPNVSTKRPPIIEGERS